MFTAKPTALTGPGGGGKGGIPGKPGGIPGKPGTPKATGGEGWDDAAPAVVVVVDASVAAPDVDVGCAPELVGGCADSKRKRKQSV